MSGWSDQKFTPFPGALDILMSPEVEQHAVIFDMISEGEIHGLVDGAASVYLNSTPLMNSSQWELFGPRATATASIDITANSAKRVTVSSTEGFFDGKTIETGEKHYISIEGAGESTTSEAGNPTFSGTATFVITGLGTTTITSSADFFVLDMVSGSNTPHRKSLKIIGAGADGSDYRGTILSINGAREATVIPAIETTVAGASGAMSHVSEIASYTADSDYCTLETAAKTSVTNVLAQLYLPTQETYDPTNHNERWNFDNTGMGLKCGTLTQTPVTNLGIQIPTASYLYAPNIQIKQNSDYKSGGTGHGGTEGSADSERFSGKAQDTVITALQVGVAVAGNIDQIIVTFVFPQGLYSQDGGTGREGPNWSEMQMWFEYQPNVGDDFITKLVFGRSSLGGEDPDKFGWGGPHEQASNMFIISGKEKTAFSEAFTIDTNQFQPF